MSPRKKDDKEIQDSTTEFFLKVIQKEKEEEPKESSTIENFNQTKTKTIDTVGRFYNYINKTLDKILSSRMSVMILSLIMAAVLFMSISGGDILTSPTSGSTLDNVPITIEGLDDDLEMTGVPSSVQVGLIGPSLDIYTTKISQNYEVYVDATGLTTGEHTISLKTRNFPDTLTVMLVPDTLKVTIAPKVTRQYQLGTRFINEDKLDAKFSISVEEMAVDEVTVRASEETLDKIYRIDACIDVDSKTEAFQQEAEIKAFDSNDKEIDVEISPTSVHVECDVASYSKEVAITPRFIGDVDSGYQISSYTLSQEKVTIYGTEDALKEVESVEVNINVQDLKATTTLSALSLKKQTGINKFSTDTVDITLQIDKVITKKFDNIPIKVLNNSSKNNVTFVGESGRASVSITGSEEKVSNITADNIQATIDVNGLSVGTRRVTVKVAVDDDTLTIERLSSERVTINIERK